jgi:hypothetical protein
MRTPVASLAPHRWALAAVVWLAAAGCVENHNGSKIELFLRGGVHIPGTVPATPGQPPSETHYELYVVNGPGVFKVAEIDIRPAVKSSDPCFIEEEGSRYPGLHSTRIVAKVIETATADGEVTPLEAGQIADAKARAGNIPALEAALKVMTMHQPGLTEAHIAELTSSVPPAAQMDDESNAARLAACQAIWRDNPGYYVGTDKITTIPLNGTYIGMVEAMDPRNGGFLGGGAIDVDASFPDFDALRLNWNFNDPDDPRRAALPPSEIGWHYMAGAAVQRVRGVYNVSLVNQDYGRRLSGEASVYTELARDDVNF